MLIPHTEYSVRPLKNRGESLPGYVCRFYWENGHEVPAQLRGSLRDLYLGREHELAARDFEITVGKLSPVEKSWWVIRCLGGTPKEARSRWLRLHYSPFRYCPACLQEYGFHLELWTLPLVDACPFHHCVLTSRCDECERSLSWSAVHPGWECGCGKALAEVMGHPATPSAIRLAMAVASASDVARLVIHGSPQVMTVLVDGGYTADELYGALHWANCLRGRLARRIIWYRNPQWEAQPTRKVHTRPGVWEERLFLAGDAVCERALRRLLRWHFRWDKTVLVETRDYGGPLSIAMEELAVLPRNRITAGLHSQAAKLLNRLNANIEEQDDVYFHPRFLEDDRQSYLVALARWWCALANRIPVLEPAAMLTNREGKGNSHAVLVFNQLVDAAWDDVDINRYSKLMIRWQIPEELKQEYGPNELMSRLTSYLGSLTSSELMFVSDLLDDAKGTGACQ